MSTWPWLANRGATTEDELREVAREPWRDDRR